MVDQDVKAEFAEELEYYLYLDYLIQLAHEPSYTMPSGMTREERRAWARSILEGDDENSN